MTMVMMMMFNCDKNAFINETDRANRPGAGITVARPSAVEVASYEDEDKDYNGVFNDTDDAIDLNGLFIVELAITESVNTHG